MRCYYSNLALTVLRSPLIDLKRLLPFEADTEYNRSDIEKLIQLKGRNLSCAIKTLVLLGIMEKQRKDKNKVYYKLRAF